MRKKTSYLLSLVLGLTCLFNLSACGGEQGETDFYAEYKLTKEQWTQCLNTTRFTFHYLDKETDGGVNVAFVDGDYEVTVYEQSLKNQVTYLYDTETVSGNTVTTLSQRAKGEKEWSEPQTVETRTYDFSMDYFAPYLNFVKDNYDSFEFVTNYYVYRAQGDELAEIGNAIAARTGNENAFVDTIKVHAQQDPTKDKFISNIIFDCENNNEASYSNRVDFNDVGGELLVRDYEKAFDTLDNFTLIGGEGLDYGEYTFTENGFRIYTPNIEDPTRQEAFWQKDGEQYIYYSKNAQGAWQKDATKTAEQYETARDNIADLLFGCLGTRSIIPFRAKNNGKTYYTFRTEVTASPYTYVFQNVLIKVDDTAKIVNATYNLEIKIGQTSATYSYTLTAGNATITFPTV